MKTDKEMLFKGIKKLAFTVLLMFLAPIVIWQAFKNEGHPLYWPVLVIGLILAMYAIYSGFKGIQTIVDALFGGKGRSKD
ncbi:MULTISPECIES: DUF6095 family protein [Maribacter]|uniref:DUF6095 family protein n=2 Tax=Maribacter TaxID=252356 RepID=A0A5B2TSI3_9FLAO|nr:MULTISPECIES: DUF6095 family protein [Maribacter]KAA2216858.1 hypothetical protein F0361_12775 [Maribacter flavus]MDC6406003.1 DUF6095 family protein [Maribacter sp. PR66]MEE1973212.1 DUF6095 family protein [Maribacter flavus]TLF44029.1 hypothetical protein FEK29_13205 [Maribacter aurantiacus]